MDSSLTSVLPGNFLKVPTYHIYCFVFVTTIYAPSLPASGKIAGNPLTVVKCLLRKLLHLEQRIIVDSKYSCLSENKTRHRLYSTKKKPYPRSSC